MKNGRAVSGTDHIGKSVLPGAVAPVWVCSVVRGATERALKIAVRDAAEAATDFAWLGKGDSVFIKPVLNSGNVYPATTSPIAIAAIVELLREKGARRVILGDMSGIAHVKLDEHGQLYGCTRKLMEQSGMAAAAVAAGAELHFFEEPGWDAFHEEIPQVGAHWKKPLRVANVLNEVQHVVTMPRCGRHALAGSSLGLKAVVGYWRLDTRLEFHHDAATLQEKLPEAWTIPSLQNKHRLVVTAADKILATYGPDTGLTYEPDTGLVIASTSLISHDMVSLAWLIQHWERVPQSDKTFFKDPYNHQLGVVLGNHLIAYKLGGIVQSLTSQRLQKFPSNSIWDDRVLGRAFEILGDLPEVTLNAANNVPDSVVCSLRTFTTRQLRQSA